MKIIKIIGLILIFFNIISICSCDEWESNSNVVSGLGDVGYHSSPTVFQMNNTWYLISSEKDKEWYGWNWTGSNWVTDNNIIAGLPELWNKNSPTVFQKNDMWYLISGNDVGTFSGFNWNISDNTWDSNNTIISGLSDVGTVSRLNVFQKDDIWYLISGEFDGVWNGWHWADSNWITDNNIIAGLPDVGYYSSPVVFQKNNKWYLITGRGSNDLIGYKWSNSLWVSDSDIASGLITNNQYCKPTFFKIDNRRYLISGSYDGTFTGFYEYRSVYTNNFNDLFESENSWDMLSSIFGSYESVCGATLFWLIIILIPFTMTWIKTQSVIIPSILALITGSTLFILLPVAAIGTIKILIVIGIAGLLYHIIKSR